MWEHVRLLLWIWFDLICLCIDKYTHTHTIIARDERTIGRGWIENNSSDWNEKKKKRMNEKKFPKIIPIRGWNVGQRYVTKCILLDVINKYSVSLSCVCVYFFSLLFHKTMYFCWKHFFSVVLTDTHGTHNWIFISKLSTFDWRITRCIHWNSIVYIFFTEMRIIRTGDPCKYSWKWLNIIIFITMN